jgi:hypothetical protein
MRSSCRSNPGADQPPALPLYAYVWVLTSDARPVPLELPARFPRICCSVPAGTRHTYGGSSAPESGRVAGPASSAAADESRAAVPRGGSLALADLELAQRSGPVSGENWVARAPDGRVVAVWPVTGPAEEACSRAESTAALSRLTEVRHPCLIPVLAVGERDGSVWVVSELDQGRPLRRLLAIAALTPEQAAAVALGTLDGLRALHEAELGHGRLHEGRVHVGTAGEIRLGGWALEPGSLDVDRRRADHEAAISLLGRLRRSVHQTGHRKTVQVDAFLAALEACCEDTGDAAALLARAHRLAAALLAGETGERVTSELASLVVAMERHSTPREVLAPARAATRAVQGASWPRAAVSQATARPAPGLLFGVALLLLVAIGAAAVLAVRHVPVRAPTPGQHARQTPGVRVTNPVPTPTTPAGPRPLPELAPSTAGPITAVEIQPLQGSCQPAAACPVQVTVRLQPQQSAREVRWSFRVFDRCTGTTSTQPGVSVTALAGWPYVFGTSWPQLPDGHPLALLAVTEMPAAAASPPVLVGGSAC